MSKWFAMGGYGIYVWPAYFITFAVLGLNIVMSLREKKHIKKIIKQYFNQSNES